MGFDKDRLHTERKRLESDLREGGMFSREKMDQRDCQDSDHEHKRVNDYVKWQGTRGKDGMTNKQKQDKWHDINRKFKEHNLESKLHTTDDLRKRRSVRYD